MQCGCYIGKQVGKVVKLHVDFVRDGCDCETKTANYRGETAEIFEMDSKSCFQIVWRIESATLQARYFHPTGLRC